MITLALPFPPTVNTVWRRVGNRTVLSKRGRQYRKDAIAAIAEQVMPPRQMLEGRLAVEVVLCPPDKRKRDIDNYAKACLDAITHSGLWQDDEQIDRLTIVRGDNTTGGGCRVEIRELS